MSPPGTDTSTVATAGGPEESPPQAMANASVHTESASLGCIFIVGSCEGESGTVALSGDRRT
jgi:hypothetical protein